MTTTGRLTSFFALPADDFERMVSVLNFLFLSFEHPDADVLISSIEKGPLYREMIALSGDTRSSLRSLLLRVYDMFSEFSRFCILPTSIDILSMDNADNFLSINSILESLYSYVHENDIPISILFRSPHGRRVSSESYEYLSVNFSPATCQSGLILLKNGDVEYFFGNNVDELMSMIRNTLNINCLRSSSIIPIEMCCFSLGDNHSWDAQTISLLNKLRFEEMKKTIINLRNGVSESVHQHYSRDADSQKSAETSHDNILNLEVTSSSPTCENRIEISQTGLKHSVENMENICVSCVDKVENHLEELSSDYYGVFNTDKWTKHSSSTSFQQQNQVLPTESQFSPSKKTLEIVDLLNSFTSPSPDSRFKVDNQELKAVRDHLGNSFVDEMMTSIDILRSSHDSARGEDLASFGYRAYLSIRDRVLRSTIRDSFSTDGGSSVSSIDIPGRSEGKDEVLSTSQNKLVHSVVFSCNRSLPAIAESPSTVFSTDNIDYSDSSSDICDDSAVPKKLNMSCNRFSYDDFEFQDPELDPVNVPLDVFNFVSKNNAVAAEKNQIDDLDLMGTESVDTPDEKGADISTGLVNPEVTKSFKSKESAHCNEINTTHMNATHLGSSNDEAVITGYTDLMHHDEDFQYLTLETDVSEKLISDLKLSKEAILLSSARKRNSLFEMRKEYALLYTKTRHKADDKISEIHEDESIPYTPEAISSAVSNVIPQDSSLIQKHVSFEIGISDSSCRKESSSLSNPKNGLNDVNDESRISERQKVRGGSVKPAVIQPPRKVGNLQQVKNALNMLCLAGGHLEQSRKEALAALDHSCTIPDVKQFLIVLGDLLSLSYKGLYSLDSSQQLLRIHGKGPKEVNLKDKAVAITKFFKFESSSRSFKSITTKVF